MIALVQDFLRSAKSAADCRRRQVAAVVVSPEGKIVGVGWNGLRNGSCTAGDCPRGTKTYDEVPAFTDYVATDCFHAEDSALQAAGERAHGGTIFVTCEPCSGCAILCEQHGVTVEVVTMP